MPSPDDGTQEAGAQMAMPFWQHAHIWAFVLLDLLTCGASGQMGIQMLVRDKKKQQQQEHMLSDVAMPQELTSCNRHII